MPNPSARSQRITTAIRVALAAVWFAACSGGGGGGDGASSSTSATPAADTTSVTLAWNQASGPVAGYSVFVQRGSGDFKYEVDVNQPRATLSGEPGSTARVRVVAFDPRHVHGPSSRSSVQFTFPPKSNGQSAAAASAGTVSAATASLSSFAALAQNSADTSEPAPADTSDDASAPDLPGGALVWQSGDAFRLTNAAIETTRLFARPADGSQLVAVADFDADGQGDLLWASASGALGYMPGDVLRGSDPLSVVDLGSLAAGERVIGAGDFDGDRHGDVLVAAGDAIHARLTTPGGAPAMADLGESAQAALAGIADFDANGSDDIAWRTAAGTLVVWMMDGGRATASVEVELAADYDVIAIGDFDGNGAAEVAVRGPLGEVFVVHPLDAMPDLEATDLANAQGWTGVGAVDFELDRSDEVVLATAGSLRFAGLPGDEVVALDPDSPWQLVALLP